MVQLCSGGWKAAEDKQASLVMLKKNYCILCEIKKSGFLSCLKLGLTNTIFLASGKDTFMKIINKDLLTERRKIKKLHRENILVIERS